MVTAVLEKAIWTLAPGWNLTGFSFTLVRTLIHLAANGLIVWVTVLILRKYARGERQRVAEPRPIAVAPEPPVVENV